MTAVGECECPGRGVWPGLGRGWVYHCPVHGMEARIAAGIWPAGMRDLHAQAMEDAAVEHARRVLGKKAAG